MGDERILRQVLRRLDVLIALELGNSPEGERISVAERISRLHELGLAPAEIASIIGKSTSHVTSALSKQRKSKKKGGQKKNDSSGGQGAIGEA